MIYCIINAEGGVWMNNPEVVLNCKKSWWPKIVKAFFNDGKISKIRMMELGVIWLKVGK